MPNLILDAELGSNQDFINYSFLYTKFCACKTGTHLCQCGGNQACKRADVHITNNNIIWW